MMHKYLMLLAMLGVSGCATYSQVQKMQPIHEADTTQTPQQFTDCALPKMVEFQADAHAMKDGDSMVIITPVGNRGADIAGTVTATPANGGSHIVMRSALGGKAEKPWAALQACL